MKKIFKNLIYISIAFLISITIFGIILDNYSKGTFTNHIIINVDDQEKIFLHGTSYVAVLNSTAIESRLNDNGFKKASDTDGSVCCFVDPCRTEYEEIFWG